MLTSKTFLRKTKRGNILKIVREHYLRDDIWCGSEVCTQCVHKENDLILIDEPRSASLIYTQNHYLLLDTNVVLDQIDVLEEDTICNVIILQTVLEEVKHKSSSVYKRLRDIIGNTKRHFYVFVNEHHKDTYVERDPGEKPNDRNDRAIRVGCLWYNKHLEKSQSDIRVILLTDDVDNRQKAIATGLIASSVRDYVASLKDTPALQDKLSKVNFEGLVGGQALYPAHLTPVQVHEGIRNGRLLQGSFQASRENYMEGWVNVEGREKPVLVVGRDGMNRSVDGDTVALELLPESEWCTPSGLVLSEESDPTEEQQAVNTGLGEVGPVSENVERAVIVKKNEAVPTGRVVGIIRRRWRQYCGVLQPNLVKGSTRHLFVPADKKISKVRIETRQADILCSQRIIVAMDSWPRHSRYPLGHLVRALGPLGDKDTENEVLLLEHDVPHSKFSEAVLACLPELPWIITPEDEAKRVDLRHIDVCSVDPPGCTDIDDALHCRKLDNGNLEVGVHIADVSHFIRPGTAIDNEAALRATTVYLVDRRIDMVPDLLSSNLCSLRGGEERFAFSCIWEVDHDANILSTKFHKSIIKSRKAMTYEEAQLIIDDRTRQDSVADSLRGLNNLAKKLKKRRIDNGALVLASPEIRFQVDSETHDPIDVEAKKIRDTNSMVEEFMLLANVSVAEKIEKEFPECAMLRRHPAPPKENFEPLLVAAKHRGIEVNIDSGKELAISLDNAVKEDNPYFNTMLRILTTRCMMQAIYFISGTLQSDEYFHYGLAAPIYTHFTSPIRRYADVIVHRLLAVCVGADSTYPQLLDKKRSSSLCVNLNFRNRMAQQAGRASVALHTHLFFRGRIQDEDGYILFVRKNALQILIPKYGLEGTLYLNKAEKSKTGTNEVEFTYNEETQSQHCGSVAFRSFDPVTVQLSLDSTNVQRERLVFKLVNPHIPGFSVPSQTSANRDVEMKEEEDEKESKVENGDGILTKKSKKKRKRKGEALT